jgi:integrase
MAKLTPPVLRGLLKKPGRHPDAESKGLYFRSVGEGKAYWVFRYRLFGHEREMSLGAYPEVKLDEARAKHAVLRAQVLNKSDPLAKREAAKAAATPSGKPTFGAVADDYVATHEGSWRNLKHRWQWSQTLTSYCGPIRSKPIDEVATADILAVLKPLWTKTPETASRLRGRIESVIDAARALGHIPEDKANPARWKGHLDKLLPKRQRLTRGHHAAMPYAEVPALMTQLAQIDSVPARALAFTILTCARTGESLGATWDEISFETATWRIDGKRMKIGKPHEAPLSDPALAILRAQEAVRNDRNSHIFPGRPVRALSNMSMAMVLRRMGAGEFTVHGFRSSFRDFAAEQGVAFELAEACLAHTVGNAVTAAYLRTSMLERRRPVMQAWADHCCGRADSTVVPFEQVAR